MSAPAAARGARGFFGAGGRTLAAALSEAGLDEATLGRAREALGRREAETIPWYVRAATGFGAWIAASLCMAALAATGIWQSATALAILGVAGAAAGIVFGRKAAGGAGEFTRQLGVVLALAGGATFTAGIGLGGGDDTATTLVAAAVSAALVALHVDPVVQFLAAGAAVVSLLLCAATLDLAVAAELLCLCVLLGAVLLGQLADTRLPAAVRARVGPVRYALLTVTLGALCVTLDDRAQETIVTPISRLGVLAILAWRMERDLAAAGASPARRALVLPILAVLGAVAWQAPGVPAALIVLGMALRERAAVMALYGVAALLLFLSGYYYSLSLPLWQKAAVLLGSGALCLMCRSLVLAMVPAGDRAGAADEPGAAPASGPDAGRGRDLLLAVGLVAAVAVPGALIAGKRALLAEGRLVLLPLAPVDPRSLMQGDYMALRYAVVRELEAAPEGDRSLPDRGVMRLRLDGDGVGTLIGLDTDAALAPDEVRLRFRTRRGNTSIGAESYFFQEGEAERFEGARYGELRVAEDGTALLVGLRDAARVRM